MVRETGPPPVFGKAGREPAARWQEIVYEPLRHSRPAPLPSLHGTSLGAAELIKGNLDAVFVSRELRPDDITGFRARFGYDPLSVPISGGSYRHFGFLDAVGIIVHKDNPIDKISFERVYIL